MRTAFSLHPVGCGLLSLALLFWAGCLLGQPVSETRMDSLNRAWQSAPTDEARLEPLLQLSSALAEFDPDSGIALSQQSLGLARKLGKKRSECRSLIYLGRNYYRISDFPAALKYDLEALRLAEAEKFKEEQNMAAVAVGSVYGTMGYRNEALQYFQQGLKLASARKDTDRIIQAYGNMSSILSDQGKFDSAISFSRQAMELSRQFRRQDWQAIQLYNLGCIYLKRKDHLNARKHFFQALALPRSNPSPELAGSIFMDLGITYKDKAAAISTLSAHRPGTQPNQSNQADSLQNSRYLLLQAVRYLTISQGYNKMLGNLNTLSLLSDHLSDAYSQLGNFQAALALYKQHISEQESIYGEKNKNALDSLTNMREQEVQQLQVDKANQRGWFLMAGLLLSLAIGGLVLSQYRLKARTNRELMAKNQEIFREKEKSEELLLNILPERSARELMETNRSTALLHPETSVLFADFKDFSLMAPNLDVQEMVGMLDTYFRAFDRIVTSEGAEKIKTIGDAYMCATGVPESDPDHACRMVRVGLLILQFVRKEGERRGAAGIPFFEIKIGINSGPLVSGIVGEKKFAFDLWGETVNLASRVEEAGAPGRLNISKNTYELVKADYSCSPRGNVIIKHGIGVQMFFVDEKEMERLG